VIGRFKLQSGVMNLKSFLQIARCLFQKSTIAIVYVAHQVRGERGFGGA
jgi:hypothetical protein